MRCSVRSSSLATVPYSMKNLLTCFHFSWDVWHSTTTMLQPQKIGICEFQLHCIEFNVPRTNFSIKQPRGENGLRQNRTRSTLSQSVSATTKPGVACPRRLQEGDKRENACPPVAYISDLIRVSPRGYQLAEK